MVTPDAKRKAVAHACTEHAVSQRPVCLALKIDRSTVRYTSTRPDDALLREAMKTVARSAGGSAIAESTSCWTARVS